MKDLRLTVKVNSKQFKALTRCVEVNGVYNYVNNVDGMSIIPCKVVDARNGERGEIIFLMKEIDAGWF